MRLILVSLGVLLASACKQRQFNSESSQSNTRSDYAQQVAQEIAKCYSSEIQTSPRSPTATLSRANKICVEHTPNSRSGAFTFKFFNGENLINSQGFNLADAQPRCMGCLDLVGLEGKAEFRGMAPSRTLTLRQNADSAVYSWLLTDK